MTNTYGMTVGGGHTAGRSVRKSRRKASQIIVAMVGMTALGVVAGCSQNNSLLPTIGNTTTADSSATQQPGAGKTVAFAPIIGAPASVSKQLSGSLISATEKNSLQVAKTAGASSDYTVRGYIVASPDAKGTEVSYIWDVLDRSDKRVHRISGKEIAQGPKQADPWANVKPEMLQGIAQKTAAQLASWVPKETPGATPPAAAQAVANNTAATVRTASATAEQTQAAAATVARSTQNAARTAVQNATAAPQRAASASATAAAERARQAAAAATRQVAVRPNDGRQVALVPPVNGAPGDGNTALAAALQRALKSQGVDTAPRDPAGAYTVKGDVKLGPPTAGKQSIQIVWTVLDADGKRVGTVSQKNTIPQGALNQRWGGTADSAARSAVGKVVSLMKQQSS